MTVEILIAVVSVVVTAIFVLPLVRSRKDIADRREYDLQVYRQQLADVDGDIERGAMSEEEAHSVRLEIERRMLKAARSKSEAKPVSKQRHLTALIVLIAVPTLSIAIYQYQGRPDLPGEPFASRAPSNGPDRAKIVALLGRVEQRLKEHPNDKRGWQLLGQGYLSLGDTTKAAETFKKAVKIFPNDVDFKSALAEALVMDSDGVIGPESLRLFKEALVADPTQVGARYYIGLAALQAGDAQKAYDDWRALAKSSPADAPWLGTVQRGLNEAAKKLGIKAEDVKTLAQAQASPPPQPSKEAVDAAKSMSKEQRDKFIHSMVDRLAARLKQSPNDLDGWLRLGRSYSVLGEGDKAAGAYKKALGLMPKDDPRRPALEGQVSRLEKSGD